MPFFKTALPSLLVSLYCLLPSTSFWSPAPDFHPDNPLEVWKQDMLNKVNLLRSKGCHCGRKYMPPAPPLTWNKQLEKSAEAHAADMFYNKFLGHRGSNGSSNSKRADEAGYRWQFIAENIAWGQTSVDEVLQGWKCSPEHCLNMMSKSYRDFAAARQGNYWVQEFGSSNK